jgi:hypothetical protein
LKKQVQEVRKAHFDFGNSHEPTTYVTNAQEQLVKHEISTNQKQTLNEQKKKMQKGNFNLYDVVVTPKPMISIYG